MSKPTLSLIAAMSTSRVIGRDNQLPWHLPADLKHFKATTMGKPILMGRKTYESIGRPLPGRLNLVLSRQADLQIQGCTVVSSVQAAMAHVQAQDAPELMVIGGGQLYAQTIDQADRLYLTVVETDIEGDAHFPEFDEAQFKITASEAHAADQANPYVYHFLTYKRTG